MANNRTHQLDVCCGGTCGDPQPGLCYDPAELNPHELNPTPWAYHQACKALWKYRAQVQRLHRHLAHLDQLTRLIPENIDYLNAREAFNLQERSRLEDAAEIAFYEEHAPKSIDFL